MTSHRSFIDRKMDRSLALMLGLRLTDHDRDIIAEFAASMPRRSKP